MSNRIRTSKKVASKASSQLRSKRTTKSTKSVADSALRNRSKWLVKKHQKTYLV